MSKWESWENWLDEEDEDVIEKFQPIKKKEKFDDEGGKRDFNKKKGKKRIPRPGKEESY